MNYKITVSANQLRVLMIALESYFRTRLGQFSDLADDIAFQGFDYQAKKTEERKEDFNTRIMRKNDSHAMFDAAFRVGQPKPCGIKTPDMAIAIDMWQVIRYQRWQDMPGRKPKWTVDAQPPLLESEEKPMTIERENTHGQDGGNQDGNM